MQGFERLGEFSRAVQASQAAGSAYWEHFSSYPDLQVAEGMLLGIMLMLPFWLAVACGLALTLR